MRQRLSSWIKFIVAAWVFAISAQAVVPPLKELVILHTADMHARVLGVKTNDVMCTPSELNDKGCFGGFARIYTRAHIERQKHKSTLLVDAGDQFQGTMFHQLYQGKVSARFMNRIGYDAMAAGNHEFDNGPKILAEFIAELKFPMLSANIDVSQSPELKNKIKPYIILRKNNLRIGIVGYTTEDTAYLANPGPRVKFLSIIPSVRAAVSALKNAKVDVIIALSHAGLARDIEVARSVDGIAAILCGHTNSLLSNVVPASDGPSPLVIKSPNQNPVLLGAPFAFGKYLGRLAFSFDSDGVPRIWDSEPILLDQRVERNKEINEEALKLYQPIIESEKEIVGNAAVDIDGQECRFEECVFGNLITDSMLAFSRKFGVSIAFMNGGGIRASIPKGPINRSQVKEVLPFEKKMVFVKLKGATIMQILEHGVSYAEDKKNDNTGRFLQVSGLKFSYYPDKARGRRIARVEVFDSGLGRYMPLDPLKIYSVATNSYLAQGGDNYTFFAQSSERWSIELELKDLLDTYFKSPFSQLPMRDGRILKLPLTTPALAPKR